jgi:hypothetical protein
VSDPAVLTFVVLPAALAVALGWATFEAWRRSGGSLPASRRAAALTLTAAAVWMTATWIAAASGVLGQWDRRPPPFAILVLATLVLAVVLALGPVGTRLSKYIPLWMLVGVHAFRLPLELAMHQMYERGVMPVQMSYSGRNFDIVTGVTAILVAWLVRSGRGGRGLVLAWNCLGLALLVNVVTVAILGTPVFAYFGPEHLNVWVTQAPFVWLPAVMVLAALEGHILVFRASSGTVNRDTQR